MFISNGVLARRRLHLRRQLWTFKQLKVFVYSLRVKRAEAHSARGSSAP